MGTSPPRPSAFLYPYPAEDSNMATHIGHVQFCSCLRTDICADVCVTFLRIWGHGGSNRHIKIKANRILSASFWGVLFTLNLHKHCEVLACRPNKTAGLQSGPSFLFFLRAASLATAKHFDIGTGAT